jgi:2-desacetyl-2-hydroxyethyl bacteriochlorophyllide A dehydrogenase
MMKIAVLTAPRHFELVDEPLPELGAGDALVRVTNCGVCTSEVDVWAGRSSEVFPQFPGHEVSGVIERAGPGDAACRAGDRVAVWVTERGFAEYVAVPAGHCFPAGNVPLSQALAEPLSCALNAVQLADVALGDDVLVIGAGFMGYLVQKLTHLRGASSLIVADTRPDALTRAASFGATQVVDVGAESLSAAVSAATGGRGADVTFEVTGAQEPLRVVGDVTRIGGTVVVVGYHQGGDRTIPLGTWNWKALRLVNAHFRDANRILWGMERAMRLLCSNRLKMDNLVTHEFPIYDIDEAFRLAEKKPDGFVKATVRL